MTYFLIGIVAVINFSLFLGKLTIGLISGSVALISDAVNSLADTVNTGVVLWATRVAHKGPDQDHQAGHDRAQPLAAFFVAIMTGVLALEVIQAAVLKFFNPKTITHESWAVLILIITIGVKGLLSLFEYRTGKKERNLALLAMSVESRGDMLISAGVILGVVLSSRLNWVWIDPLIALAIGCYILYTAWLIARENINYLMGATAAKADVDAIVEKVLSVPEVKDYHDLTTQHLGDKIQVTVHCEIAGNFSIAEWHNLEKKIMYKVGELDRVTSVYVHLDHIN